MQLPSWSLTSLNDFHIVLSKGWNFLSSDIIDMDGRWLCCFVNHIAFTFGDGSKNLNYAAFLWAPICTSSYWCFKIIQLKTPHVLPAGPEDVANSYETWSLLDTWVDKRQTERHTYRSIGLATFWKGKGTSSMTISSLSAALDSLGLGRCNPSID